MKDQKSNTKLLPASLSSPYPPLSRPPTPARPIHVVLASTGSVASVKIPLIVQRLLTYSNIRIQIIATDSSLHFYDPSSISQPNPPHSFSTLTSAQGDYTVSDLANENSNAESGLDSRSPRVHVWTTADEWSSFKAIGDPILHIELRRWADIVLIAPCSANTLAKLNAGICDDLLTSFMRALSSNTPTVLFPAMNTLMWDHPLTAKHVQGARELGYEIMGPVEKKLACGDTGRGAMTEWSDIVQLVVDRFALVKDAQAQGSGVRDKGQGSEERGST